MARAETVTWLPLDRWSEIIGVHPLHFNQLNSEAITSATICDGVIFQYAWQYADRIGREDISLAIREAERAIASAIGYNLLPDWTSDERANLPRPSRPELYSLNGKNPRWQAHSVTTRKAYYIEGGTKAKAVIEAASAVTRSDVDGDGYSELCTVSVTTTITAADEIRVFYPGESGADKWEVRPIEVSISGGVATITFKSWQIVDPDTQQAIIANRITSIDADTAGNYLTTVDVYRVYNDIETQLRFMWEAPNNSSCMGCPACVFGTQTGCLHARDTRLGIVVPEAGTYSSSDNAFTAKNYAVCRGPDQIKLWYRSGNLDNSLARPYAQMEPALEYAVAYYAASLLDHDLCGCSNVQQRIKHWRGDRSHFVEGRGFQTTPSQIDNPLGTTMGANYAWRIVKQPGRRVAP